MSLVYFVAHSNIFSSFLWVVCWFNRWNVKCVWKQAYVLSVNGAKFGILHNNQLLEKKHFRASECPTWLPPPVLSATENLPHPYPQNLMKINVCVRWLARCEAQIMYIGVEVEHVYFWSMVQISTICDPCLIYRGYVGIHGINTAKRIVCRRFIFPRVGSFSIYLNR
jgi:hypothetical protein